MLKEQLRKNVIQDIWNGLILGICVFVQTGV